MSNSSSCSSSENGEYESSYQAEKIEEYKKDGYHPVQLGENFNNQYKVIQKLGYGTFSTV